MKENSFTLKKKQKLWRRQYPAEIITDADFAYANFAYADFASSKYIGAGRISAE